MTISRVCSANFLVPVFVYRYLSLTLLPCPLYVITILIIGRRPTLYLLHNDPVGLLSSYTRLKRTSVLFLSVFNINIGRMIKTVFPFVI